MRSARSMRRSMRRSVRSVRSAKNVGVAALQPQRRGVSTHEERRVASSQALCSCQWRTCTAVLPPSSCPSCSSHWRSSSHASSCSSHSLCSSHWCTTPSCPYTPPHAPRASHLGLWISTRHQINSIWKLLLIFWKYNVMWKIWVSKFNWWVKNLPSGCDIVITRQWWFRCRLMLQFSFSNDLRVCVQAYLDVVIGRADLRWMAVTHREVKIKGTATCLVTCEWVSNLNFEQIPWTCR